MLAVESDRPARGAGTIAFVTERSSGGGAGAPPPGRRHERAKSEGRTSPDDAWFLGKQERRARPSLTVAIDTGVLDLRA